MSKLRQIALDMYKRLAGIDNGRCTVCSAGFRYWTSAGANGPMRPCENSECPTHAWEKELGITLAPKSDVNRSERYTGDVSEFYRDDEPERPPMLYAACKRPFGDSVDWSWFARSGDEWMMIESDVYTCGSDGFADVDRTASDARALELFDKDQQGKADA